MYEVIVLGATFAAAGIAHRLKENCLIIESRCYGGYEFFGDRNFSNGDDLSVYPFFKKCHTIFCTDICSIQKSENGFICETHGVDGFVSYETKKIIDTRTTAAMCSFKTYPMLIESSQTPCLKNAVCRAANGKNRFIAELTVPLDCGFSEARRRALEFVKNFDSQRLILLADEFTYTVKKGYPKLENGILYLPSAASETPALAFNAGEEAVK